MVIATMPFIRYHKMVADFLMNLREEPPAEDPRWPHAAAFVEPQIDQRRGYISGKERSEREAVLFDELYATPQERVAASATGERYAPPVKVEADPMLEVLVHLMARIMVLEAK